MSGQTKIGRLALRQEGEWWNAYYALTDTMEGAVLLGPVRLGAVARSEATKQAFMEMMRGIVADIIEGKTGVRPSWGGPEAAPLHERAGNG